MTSKQRTYGILGVNYQDSGFRPTGAPLGVDTRTAQLEMQAMRCQSDSTKKALSASKPRQSTPKELREWLEGRPVTADEEKVGVLPYPNLKVFSRAFADNELRAFVVKDNKRTEVYAHRIIGGEFGSSGSETTVSLLSAEEGYEHDRLGGTLHAILRDGTVVSPSQEEFNDREWGTKGASTYAPSTSIDNYRITTHWNDEEEEPV